MHPPGVDARQLLNGHVPRVDDIHFDRHTGRYRHVAGPGRCEPKYSTMYRPGTPPQEQSQSEGRASRRAEGDSLTIRCKNSMRAGLSPFRVPPFDHQSTSSAPQ